MSGPLPSKLRKALEDAVTDARRHAEDGARAALTTLAVAEASPHDGMSDDAKALRRRLRARGRQLGDRRDATSKTQAVDRLVHEIAYEQWHRMLFARFLAENGLLIHPELNVPVSLDEIEEIAAGERRDADDLAASYAQRALPQIFRSDDPVLEVELAREHVQALKSLLSGLPSEVFTADDSLGWTYQYWQKDKKDAVNKSGVKIGADEISPVTQLFTEHYMVLFLYHNTIGAWHAGKVLAAKPELAKTASSEQELRGHVRLSAAGGYDFEYLRFVRTQQEGDEEGAPSGPWRPAAGVFAEWPQVAKELTILDPCCGSGHFLTAGLELMVRLRMEEEALGVDDAVRAVLQDNLHGLEIDPRCTQIAPFNVAMAAWKLAGKPLELPSMHIACSGLALGSSRAEWQAIAGDDDRLKAGMEELYDLFQKAPTLGSLLDPRSIGGGLYTATFEQLAPLLDEALGQERGDKSDEHGERVIAAKGMAAAGTLLARRYTLCITNVPYLGAGKQDEVLADYGEANHPEAKNDLATMFVERMLQWGEPAGSIAAVAPQNWLFLTSYKKLREKLLKRRRWDFVARLGVGAFETISGHVVNVALPVISSAKANDDQIMGGLDVSDAKTAADKAALLRGELVEGLDRGPDDFALTGVEQAAIRVAPNAAVNLVVHASVSRLGDYCDSIQGIGTSDNNRFVTAFWEHPRVGGRWTYVRGSAKGWRAFRGMSSVLLWEDGNGAFRRFAESLKKEGRNTGWNSGSRAWGRLGVSVSEMAELPFTPYLGEKYLNTAHAVIPEDPENLAAVLAFLASGEMASSVREIHQGLKVSNKVLLQAPFDLEHWKAVAAEDYPGGPHAPQSNDPTQWIFHGHPAGMLEKGYARDPNPADVLQVAVGRLLGYRWPAERDAEMQLDARAREWVAECDALLPLADDDGIVCLQAVKGESSAADRVRALLAKSLGDGWSAAHEREFLSAIASANSTEARSVKPANNLEEWLRDDFFVEHCVLFHDRPLVWHIWDGQKHGFHCLVNAHKLTGPHGIGRKTLEGVAYAYLGDWIDKQEAAIADGAEGADVLLAAAVHLQGELKKILAGEPPYDIFVRWKSLAEQSIGWDPDISDGVRLNIRPFMSAMLRSGGKRGAGVLRAKPNIKWGKDGGKEPQADRACEDHPWFWGCDGGSDQEAARLDWTAEKASGKPFDGNRWNDLHYSNAVKKQARADAQARGNAGGQA